MAKTVALPAYFNIGALYAFTGAVVGHDGHPTDNHFIFDFKHLHFVDGSGLTVFCNTLEWLLSLGVQCQFQNHANINPAISYLDDCGFFRRHLGQQLKFNATVRGTTLPFTRVAHAEAHGWLEYNFTPWMGYKLGCNHGALGSLRACVGELFNNILDHSTQEIGFVHVQHYPAPNHIQITLSDFGKGIPSNIRARFGPMLDGDAIWKASQEGVTSQSVPRNQGIGLNFLVDSVTGNEGYVSIFSFQGSLTCYKVAGAGVTRVPSTRNASYPGTLINITLPIAKFVGDDDDEETMEW